MSDADDFVKSLSNFLKMFDGHKVAVDAVPVYKVERLVDHLLERLRTATDGGAANELRYVIDKLQMLGWGL